MVLSLDFDSKIFKKDVIEVADGKESVVKGGRDLFPERRNGVLTGLVFLLKDLFGEFLF